MVTTAEAPFRQSSPGDRKPHIELQAVCKQYESAQGHRALESVDLRIGQGEFVCLVGPSGWGKTTILNIIAGLEKPTGGRALVSGEAITGPSPERTVVFQDGALFPWLTVERNVAFALEVAGVP